MSAINFDEINWEQGADYIRPISALPMAYPTESDVTLNVVYGFSSQYTGSATSHGGVPDTPTIRIINNQDDTATATISGSQTGSTNTVWIFLRHGGVMSLVNGGSRVNDGDVTITKPEGEYIGYVIATIDGLNSLPSDPDGFWITQDYQYTIRTAAAEAELQVIRLSQFGREVEFKNGSSATPVTVWATLDAGRQQIQLRNTTRTDQAAVTFYIPRQTSFPPAEFAVGATVTYDSKEYEIDTLIPNAGEVDTSSGFECVCGRYKEGGNY